MITVRPSSPHPPLPWVFFAGGFVCCGALLRRKARAAADMLAERGIPLAKVDGDANPGLLKKFAIESFPTMLVSSRTPCVLHSPAI